MNYSDAVQAAAAALERGEQASWELAELTYEATSSGPGRPRNSLGPNEFPIVTVSQWCADIRAQAPGIKFSAWSGQLYRGIWAAFRHLPAEERPSWNEAYKEVYPAASNEATYSRHADAHLKNASAERKRELFERLRADPDVIEPTISVVPGPPPLTHADPAPMAPTIPEPITAVRGALRLAVFISDARMAAQHYAQTLGEVDLDGEGRQAEAAAIDTVLRAWERLRLIINAPGGLRVVEEVEDFLADARA